MEKQKFEAVLVLLVPQIVELIAQKYAWDEVTAHREFYGSKVYQSLEQEDTKLWHLSAMALFSMYEQERETGVVPFPEEA